MWKDNFLVETLPGICLLTVISVLMLKYVWGGKKGSKASGSKVIVIASCDSVVGWECAKRLDKLGFHVFAGFRDKDSDKAQRLKSRTSSRVTAIKMDVTSEEGVERAAKYVSDHLPPSCKGVYCVLNNTMSLLQGDFDWYTSEQYEKLIERNLLGNIRTTMHFLSLLRNEKGRIINICSTFGFHAYPYYSIFSAANAAIQKLTECLSFELADLDITTSVIEEYFLSADGQNDEYSLEDMWENIPEEKQIFYLLKYDNFRKSMKEAKSREFRLSKEYRKRLVNVLETAILSDCPKPHYRALPCTLQTTLMEVLFTLPHFLRWPLIKFFYYSNQCEKMININKQGLSKQAH